MSKKIDTVAARENCDNVRSGIKTAYGDRILRILGFTMAIDVKLRLLVEGVETAL